MPWPTSSPAGCPTTPTRSGGPASSTFDVPGPGRLLLVSDGLWNYTLEPAHLVAAMGDPTSERIDLARRLVTFANDAGGSDNITVVVVDLPLLKGSSTP